jgi:hypothetical protein
LRFGKPTIDLEATIGAEILKLHQAGNVLAVLYDPYQMHSLAISLQKAGVRMIELPQTTARIESDQALYVAVIARSLRHYGDPTLTEHIHNAIAIESPRGWRLAKERTTKKIDAAVALSMAHYGALTELKRYGSLRILPNIFYGEHEGRSLDEFLYTPGGFEHLPDRNVRPHPPGVTHENCRHRNRGCEACVAELTEEKWYEEQERIAKMMLGRGAGEPMSEEEAARLYKSPAAMYYQIQKMEAQNESKFISKFRSAVNTRLEKRN